MRRRASGKSRSRGSAAILLPEGGPLPARTRLALVPARIRRGLLTTGRVLLAAAALAGVPGPGPGQEAFAAAGAGVPVQANQVLWFAGVTGSHTVRPDARKQTVLVLEALNSYARARNLRSLRVTLRGTAAGSEYDTWALYPDTNQNGAIDDNEA